MLFWNYVLVIISLIVFGLGMPVLAEPLAKSSVLPTPINVLVNVPDALSSVAPSSVDWSSSIDRPQIDAFNQGIQATQDGRYLDALQFFTDAIATDKPETKHHLAAAYANRCLIRIQLNQYQAAIEDCTQAVAKQPANVEAYLNRGLAQYRLGNYQAAIEDNNCLLTLQPDDLRAYFNRGLAAARLGKHPTAIADYNRALEYHPESQIQAEIHIDKGLSIAALSDLPGALATFDRAISLNAISDRAYYNRGCIHGQMEDYLAAIQDFDQALQLNPAMPEAHLDRAIAFYNLGNSNQALDDLQQAAADFQLQGKQLAYQQTLGLMQQIRRSLNAEVFIG